MDPNTIEYLRQFRIGGFTIFDTSASILGVFLLAPLLSGLFRFIGLDIPRKSWLYLVLPMGILAHYLSGIKTPMVKEFLDPSGYYLLKAVIIFLLILGLKGMKKIKK